jgi:PfaB family protein
LQIKPEKGYIASSLTFFIEEFVTRLNDHSPIAVVAMAGVFPGASTLDQFWHNIVHKKNACGDIPESRWISRPADMVSSRPAPDKAFHRRGCVIQDFTFDPDGFAMPAELLSSLDPMYHLVLHAGRQAFSAFQSAAIDKDRIAVILAAIALPTEASSGLAQEILGESFKNALFQKDPGSLSPLTRNQCLASQVTALPAAVLAQALGLGGPAFTLDAACASSLYAVKLACDMLSSHRCDAVLAGGVSRPDCLYTQVGFSQLRALSVSGRCAPFDARADGLIVGEGAGILVLKRLEDALKDGDSLFGVIRGIGLSNDMRGNLLAPDTEGQLRAMQAAYQDAGWNPADVDIIECHGAGTPVGDAMELQSLNLLWENTGSKSGQCPIGSVKSMIGHLLTAAGAAGLIKTLLAIKHQTLPPSLNYTAAAENSPLHGSPFRVQTLAQPWHRREPGIPRRAAISAFGFGGINGHVLLEEWDPKLQRIENSEFRSQKSESAISRPVKPQPLDIAVVGMDACFGSFQDLKAFQEAVLSGNSGVRKRPEVRWKGCDAIAGALLDFPDLPGGYIAEITLELNDLHIPPNEIPDILLQHLLMLKVSHRAMADAGFTSRKLRPRMGAVIGMGFDMEATDYYVRWGLGNTHSDWLKQAGVSLVNTQKAVWLESLKNDFGPALNTSRTLGALAGIVASRVAREFSMGAPSFTVSADSASGFSALEIAARLLQQNEADAMLVGAVDLAGDVRSILMAHGISPFSPSGNIRPFDRSADGSLPGEGSAAVVLKRLDQAMAEGDRIYGVIKGIGSACAGPANSPAAYSRSLRQSLAEAGIPPGNIGFFEAHGSGRPSEDQLEARALNSLFGEDSDSVAIGSVKSVIGHAGAAAGMASLIKTCLCLYQEILPPLVGYTQAPDNQWRNASIHVPGFAQYWARNRQDGPRRACCATMTSNGACSHVVLEGHGIQIREQGADIRGQEKKSSPPVPGSRVFDLERRSPLGLTAGGLFIIEGKDRDALIKGLNLLDQHIQQQTSLEPAAGSWFERHPLSIENPYAVSLVAETPQQLKALIETARQAVLSGTSSRISGRSGIVYRPKPMGISGQIAFVFPGSGNHYVGMGRTLAVTWPELLRQMDAETPELKTQMVPAAYVPFRQSWASGWETETMNAISADPLIPIFGQVFHGSLMTRLIKSFSISPQAVIGYSLGETAGLFALGAWPDRGEMLFRLAKSSLFHTELAGPCNAARKAWNIAPSAPFHWKVAAVNRPSGAVKSVLTLFSLARLLIVNSPEECVIGGNQADVEGVITALKCEAVYLDGVVTVHCDAAIPVRKAYRSLHRFPTVQPRDIRFYSCALNRAYALNTESAADSITRQAMSGFDFTKTIHQAYADGVRTFIEMGPHSSCTRMISRTLEDRPHLAVSASSRGEDEVLSILKLLAALAAERIFIDLAPLYGANAGSAPDEIVMPGDGRKLIIQTGSSPFRPKFPQPPVVRAASPPDPGGVFAGHQNPERGISGDPASFKPETKETEAPALFSTDMLEAVVRNAKATADAHASFLRFSNELSKDFADGFAMQTRLLQHQLAQPQTNDGRQKAASRQPHIHPRTHALFAPNPETPCIAYPRSLCMEFAIGSCASVLGLEFAEVDTYPARVRLPDEPLMLVDRILSVDGQKGSLGQGRVITEHDVVPGAWYLDGGHAPVCISVEAGQADLFLCAYLGIDLQVKGLRTYRLLDAAVQFHRGLPLPGDVIRYEIEIERFVRQGQTWLFFFHFKGFIGNTLLITMENGCAGFFTEMEVKNSGGIILTEPELQRFSGKIPLNWKDLIPRSIESFSDSQVDALRSGNLDACFGTHFSGIVLSESLCLPGGRMHLIDRVLTLDPGGGRYGLGMIQAQADIHPDDWFLTCHFMDDPVMPGTLMYECCAHTLRVFIQRMGWVSDRPGVCYEPVVGVKSILKCRGPVTPQTRHVMYQVEISELGYAPEPYVIADAHMFADGQHIVMFRNISLKMTGITRQDIETFWQIRHPSSAVNRPSEPIHKNGCFEREQILALSVGKPSDAFGETFRPFDKDRFLARLPGPPYLFVDRIVKTEPPAFVLKPGGWIEAEYTVSPSDWYFSADRSGIMPYAVLLEIALQPCGWLAAYAGSALSSPKDLRFRNLGGTGHIHQDVFPDSGTLTMRCRMTQVSAASDMIIESFDFAVASGDKMIYDGQTTFGFFTESTLAKQKGLANADDRRFGPDPDDGAACRPIPLADVPPYLPEPGIDFKHQQGLQMTMPGRAIRMMDVIETYDPAGGPAGLGYIQGSKKVDPEEWFFKAHFYQDPVWPGSLGVEAFIQLLKFIAIDRWPHLASECRFSLITGARHAWTYRGQVIPGNQKVTVDAVVTRIDASPCPLIVADGFLSVDGLTIYEMKQFGIRLMHGRL